VPRGRDVFKSPQGCSGTHPVGKGDFTLAPQSRSNSRSVGKDETSHPVVRAPNVRDARFVPQDRSGRKERVSE